MATLIANVGLRDVQPWREVNLSTFSEPLLPNKRLPQERIREIGEILMGDDVGKRVAESFGLPIISSYINYLDEKGVSVDRLILFATEQDHPEYRKSDTYPLAQAIRKHKERFGLPETIEVAVEVLRHNPANLDALLNVYEPRMKTIFAELKSPRSDGQVYIGLTGGTPQMNQALLIGSTTLSPSPILLHKPENGPVRELSILRRLRFRSRIDVAELAKDRHEYVVIAEMFEDYPTLPPTAPLFHYLARYALARLNAAFGQAIRELDQVQQEVANDRLNRDLGNQLIRDSDRWREQLYLMKQDKEHLFWLFELLYQAKVYHRQAAYFPMVLRLASFREQALRHFLRRCGVMFDQEGSRIDRSWLDEHPEVEEYLAQYRRRGGKGIKVRDAVVNQLALVALAQFFSQSDPAVDLLVRMSPLVELRNVSVHGLEGISPEVVRRKLEEGFAGWRSQGAAVDGSGGGNEAVPDILPSIDNVDALIGQLEEVARRFLTEAGPSAVIPPNPYDEVNAYLDQLIDLAR